MKILKSLLLIHALVLVAAAQQRQGEVPREWIDPDTGHRVVRLSEEPGSQSLYFHQNAYTPDGTKLIMTTPSGISVVNLKTRAVEKVVDGRVSVIIVGHKTGQVYYTKFVREPGRYSATVYATDLDTKATREVVKLPPGVNVNSVNADETLLAGTLDEKVARDIAEGRFPRGPAPLLNSSRSSRSRPSGAAATTTPARGR
jgi:oligogalacturonide lyase